MAINKPLVSIIMSVFNGQEHLKESIDSLLNQTYHNLEIIIVNDGSTDSTREVIRFYNDKRIVFIDRNENLGLTKSLNEGLALCRGNYIARQDVGDISFRTRIEQQVDFLQDHSEISILGSAIEWFNFNRTLKRFVYNGNPDNVRSRLLSFFNPIPHSTLMFRKEVVERLSGYNNYFVLAQDYDFLLRASEIFKITSLPKPLVKLRFNPSSLTHAGTEQLKFGLAALICAHRRLKGLIDYSKTGGKQWQLLLQQIDSFIKKKKLDRKFTAKKYLNAARFSSLHFNFLQCLGNLFCALKNDKWVFLKRAIALKIPDDIEAFVSQPAFDYMS